MLAMFSCNQNDIPSARSYDDNGRIVQEIFESYTVNYDTLGNEVLIFGKGDTPDFNEYFKYFIEYDENGLKVERKEYYLESINSNFQIVDSLDCTKYVYEYNEKGNLVVEHIYKPFFDSLKLKNTNHYLYKSIYK